MLTHYLPVSTKKNDKIRNMNLMNLMNLKKMKLTSVSLKGIFSINKTVE
jgi:hypothetical protein